jgi:hypothetical protein
VPYDTKAEFDAAYRTMADKLIGGTVDGEPRVYIHYHYAFMGPGLAKMWQRLVPILGLDVADPTLVVGAGFGWGIEGLEAALGAGANVVGTDISAYIQTEKTTSEEAELRQHITDAGLDPDTGRGAFVLQELLALRGPGARSRVIVLDEDAQTNTSRQAIRSALGAWPSICIIENLIDPTTTAQEITQLSNAMNLFAGNQRVIWIHHNDPTGWTTQAVFDLTGEEVISPTGDPKTHRVPPAA